MIFIFSFLKYKGKKDEVEHQNSAQDDLKLEK